MDFGKTFRELRKQCGLSQKQVATALGIHQSNISDWENDISRPEYEKLFDLAKLYGVTLYEILGQKEDF